MEATNLSKHEAARLKALKKVQHKSQTVWDAVQPNLKKLVARVILIAIMLILLTEIEQLTNYLFLLIGGLIGATLRDFVWIWQGTKRWPLLDQIIDWPKVDELIREYDRS